MTSTAPLSRIGLTVATWRGTFPGEFDHAGVVFTLTSDTGDSGVLTLFDTGNGLTGWVSVASTTPFTSLRFTASSGSHYVSAVYRPPCV